MRIVATSDTHYPADPSMIPAGDVFIHAGDLTRWGDSMEWKDIIPWLGALPHKHKIFVAGNHDFHIFHYPGPSLQQLRNLGVMVVGLPDNPNYETVELPNKMKLLGLPYVTDLPRWAFNTTEKKLDSIAKRIKEPIDIIVSHSPPLGILDTGFGVESYTKTFLPKFKPRYWFFGHIHEEYGMMEKDGTQFYNAAMCNRAYVQANAPFVIDV